MKLKMTSSAAGRARPPIRLVGCRQASLVDERHPVAEPFGLFHEVGDQDDRHAAGPHPLDQPPGIPAGLGVQAGGHLVQDGEPGPADQRQHDRQPMPLPAGQGPVIVAVLAGQAERPC